MESKVERILILCKTYPSPSAKHAETSCVAGITEAGQMRRLYPVPFRLIQDQRQFKKWQWITARTEKARDDARPESYKLYVDTIECKDDPIPPDHEWRARRPWIERLPAFDSFDAAEEARQNRGVTLAVVRPKRIEALEIKAVASPEWSDEERAKLLKLQNQGNLFEETAKDVRLLKKLPFDFHYRYTCDTASGSVERKHKIVDWEAGALFWNVHRKHKQFWEAPFRAKLEQGLPGYDLMFLMGTIHRFPDQWLIVSLIYPPKPQPEDGRQGSLL